MLDFYAHAATFSLSKFVYYDIKIIRGIKSETYFTDYWSFKIENYIPDVVLILSKALAKLILHGCVDMDSICLEWATSFR